MTFAPDQLPNDIAALQAIIAEQAKAVRLQIGITVRHQSESAVIEQLQLNLDKLKRSQFGQSSEKVQRQINQLELALEDLQTDRAAELAKANGGRILAAAGTPGASPRGTNCSAHTETNSIGINGTNSFGTDRHGRN